MTALGSTLTGRRGRLHARRAAVCSDEITTWFGLAVTGPARTVLDLARHDRAAGLVAADFAVRHQLCERERLHELVARSSGWPGNRSARWVSEHVDPLSESPLESITRLVVSEAGLPTPRLQAWITDGTWRYRVDLLWDEARVILEADGRLKYAGDRDALWNEKLRQHRLEAAGYRVLRTIWSEVTGDPQALVARIRRALSA